MLASTCIAQNYVPANIHDSVPAGKIIFEDDFNKDTIGEFPSRWHLSEQSGKNDDGNKKQHFKVEKENNYYILSVQHDSSCFIEPNIDTSIFPEKFDLEYDFILQSQNSSISLALCVNPFNGPCGNLFFAVKNKGRKVFFLEQLGWYKYYKSKDVEYPVHSDLNNWHHFRINFDHGKIKCFIDQYCMMSMPEANYYPRRFSLGFYGTLKIKNFRVATSDSTFNINKILTDKKFVTHAINFDVSKSTIKQESMGFIAQLAQFLKKNPTIKLEIDGHTDSDGDAAANMALSQARADEVKKKLVLLGIAEKRLTAKGFGATKPIKPNNTAENKAENRRVEFIKL